MTPAVSGPPASPSNAVTGRAVALGLLLTVGLNLIMCYSDMHLKNTLLTGNHFPTAGMIVLLFLVLGANTASQKWFRRRGFSQGEMLLVWAMVCVAGGIGNTALMRYVPGWAAAPAYYTTKSNDYATHLLANIPDWMVVSKDLDSPAVRWYFEGLPRGEHIPWGVWVRPLAVWGAFGGLVSAVMFAFCSLFYRQWADRERLIFPMTYLPLEVTAPAGRSPVNAFLSNRLVWLGAAVPIIVFGINGLRTYFPGIPSVPIQWSATEIFPDRPWSEFQLEAVRVYFSIVGLTFLLTTEVSFSLWFFYILYRLSFVYVAWLGAGATGYWGNWYRQIPVFQTAGATLVIGAFLFWAARGSLRAWARRVAQGGDDRDVDLLPPRLTLVLLVAGFGGMIVWMLKAEVSWWAAAGGLVLFLTILLVLTRIVAEAGVLMVATTAIPYDVLTPLLPSRWLTGPTVSVFMMHKGVFMHDLREILLPYLMNGVRVCDALRMNLRKVLAVLALTAAVAFVVAAYGRITTAYKYGGLGGDEWANLQSQYYFYGDMVDFLKNPPEYDWTKIGDVRIMPVSVAHVVTGAVVAAGMLVMRAQFLWWPLNPFGFLLCGTWAMVLIWFSMFLGWAFKAAVMTFGGASTYRKCLPFFLGLVLGEAMIATVWVVTSLITGRPGLYILPD